MVWSPESRIDHIANSIISIIKYMVAFKSHFISVLEQVLKMTDLFVKIRILAYDPQDYSDTTEYVECY